VSRAVTDLELPAKERALKLLQDVRTELGVTLIIVHTLRTWEEQANIYAQGRTRPGPIVTKAKPGYSWHNFGLAFDVAVLEKGKIVWELPATTWTRIGEIAEALGLVWGGWFKNLADRGHFEFHPEGQTLATLRAAHDAYLARTGGHNDIKWS